MALAPERFYTTKTQSGHALLELLRELLLFLKGNLMRCSGYDATFRIFAVEGPSNQRIEAVITFRFARLPRLAASSFQTKRAMSAT